MYIRRTTTRSNEDAQNYCSYRLVQSTRTGQKVRQRTLLNLGSQFALPHSQWPLLCIRIEQLLSPQAALIPISCKPEVEQQAQRIAAQLLVRDSQDSASIGEQHTVDVNSIESVRPRSVGVEHAALWAMQQLDFADLLKQLGLNGPQRGAIVGSVIARMAKPGSERATHAWLQHRSALGELTGVDFESMSAMQLYRASDRLMAHRAQIESQLFEQALSLFDLQPTITFYDLTNTYFEGRAGAQPKARRGRSKEKRSDCPLLTLALVLDGSGFVVRSQVFAGNVSEGKTLQEMLRQLHAPKHALVVMDRGVATAQNRAWLHEHGYCYLVVSREQKRNFDPEKAQVLQTSTGEQLRLYQEPSKEGTEVKLYCYSEARAQKEAGIAKRFAERFEQALEKLHAGLSRPRARKSITGVWQRIGRLQEQSRGISRHYQVEVIPDAPGTRATAVTWKRLPLQGTMMTHPGVYCLHSNKTDWDAKTLWRTYIRLTDIESVFRSLKSELGLRPIYHQTPIRTEGHLFISVLAYQFVQVIRHQLHLQGITGSWTRLRNTLEGQVRTTITFGCADRRTLHVRKASRAEPEQQSIYSALGIDPAPGGIQKSLI